nr:PC-esterase domain-containing protein 1A isoform X2 [Scatophagus argus]
MSFEQDSLVEGGCLGHMHNGTEYREVRQFQSAHHLVRFYFVTRIYSRYMQSILEDFRRGLTPDIVIVNSCVWDISRYSSNWIDVYKENLHKFFVELNGILPEETLVIWNLTMPLAERIKGGFLVPEIEHKAPQLRHDVIEANFYSGNLADSYGIDVLDLHFQFRFSLRHRTKDGVHWNALAHRRITSLLLQHTAQAWGVIMPCPVTVEYAEVADKQPPHRHAAKHAGGCRMESVSNYVHPRVTSCWSNKEHPSRGYYNGYSEEFVSDSLCSGYLDFDEDNRKSRKYHRKAARPSGPALPPLLHLPYHRHKHAYGWVGNDFNYRPPHHFEPYKERHHYDVMRSRHTRHHYAPYTHHRPSQYERHGRYY